MNFHMLTSVPPLWGKGRANMHIYVCPSFKPLSTSFVAQSKRNETKLGALSPTPKQYYSKISLQETMLQQTLGYKIHSKMVWLAFICSPYSQHCIQETWLCKKDTLLLRETSLGPLSKFFPIWKKCNGRGVLYRRSYGKLP